MWHSPLTLLRPLVLLIPALLAACSTPYRPAVVVRDSAPFPGIVNLVQNGGGRPLDVILVHGMCTHDAAWANHGIDRIAGVVSANVPAQAVASSNGIQLVERRQQIGGTPVRFHALIWSPLTAPLKRQLDYDNTGTPTDCSSAGNGECKPKRAWLNGYVKDRLLNDCLSDVVIYEGKSGNAIREAMVESVSRIIESNPNGERTLAVVAESLGSKILFDALSSMLESTQPRTRELGLQASRRLGLLFMAGNQLPILGLAGQNIERQPDLRSAGTPDALQRFLELRRRQAGSSRAEAIARLAVVAFTDPNDLLSYRLLPARYAAPDVAVADVLVSNARTWLGLIENPVAAHLDYLENPDVGDLIACGYPRFSGCR
ncbi:hypothetical protein ACFQ09_19435 [Massilia norwichensis]|uniref:Uncharacterized protein n=1 Tax=Massilia norwichensis TaxID=1442366 RepID=A0ABT2ACG4_9BURK|nr:hypothetical protein [Massilia norwichensis]MCS0591823.1 hypothetical protein [Massilia norwichensis]